VRALSRCSQRGWRCDDRQDLGGRGLLLQRFRKRSITFGKLALQISYKLLGIG
jgi:hypothetical protein